MKLNKKEECPNCKQIKEIKEPHTVCDECLIKTEVKWNIDFRKAHKEAKR